MQNYIEELPVDAKRIEGTMNWVDPRGNMYGFETRVSHMKKYHNKYFKYSLTINNHNGYVYGPIKYIIDEKKSKYENRQRRIHILVAEAFLENPNNYPVVGHRNNIKSDNRVDNLYWTTIKENTQKAYDDGLAINTKGYDDSQSNPVIMFDTYTNKEIGRFGSICIASRETGIEKGTIARQAKYKKPVRKPYYFRFQDDESAFPPTIIIQYDFKTGKEINRFYNTFEASRITGVDARTIGSQCKLNRPPKWTKSGSYFRYSN